MASASGADTQPQAWTGRGQSPRLYQARRGLLPLTTHIWAGLAPAPQVRELER